MGMIPEVQCRRCGESFSSMRSTCPHCGTRRVVQSGRTPGSSAGTVKGNASYERAETNTKWQMIFGLILVVAVILAVIVMVSTSLNNTDIGSQTKATPPVVTNAMPTMEVPPTAPPPPPFSQPMPWQDFSDTPPMMDPPIAERKNPLATASMVLGIVTWGGLILCCGCFSPVTAILAIIFAIASRDNKKMNGMAVAGLLLGAAFLCLFFMLLLLLITGSVFETSSALEEESAFSLFFRSLL